MMIRYARVSDGDLENLWSEIAGDLRRELCSCLGIATTPEHLGTQATLKSLLNCLVFSCEGEHKEQWDEVLAIAHQLAHEGSDIEPEKVRTLEILSSKKTNSFSCIASDALLSSIHLRRAAAQMEHLTRESLETRANAFGWTRGPKGRQTQGFHDKARTGHRTTERAQEWTKGGEPHLWLQHSETLAKRVISTASEPEKWLLEPVFSVTLALKGLGRPDTAITNEMIFRVAKQLVAKVTKRSIRSFPSDDALETITKSTKSRSANWLPLAVWNDPEFSDLK